MSLHIAKFFIRPLTVASAALVIHIGAAAAADSSGDIQQQMREVLTGVPAAHFASQSAPRDSKPTTPPVDSQEFVRQILLGTTASHVGNTETLSPSVRASDKTDTNKRPVVHGDIQAEVRQILLGQHHASNAS